MKYTFLIIFLATFSTLTAQEQEEEWPGINADRPGQGTDSPFLLPTGAVQLENGLLFQRDQLQSTDAIIKTYYLPTGLVRVGLLQNLEFRFSYDLLLQRDSFEDELINKQTGFAPFSLGAKFFIGKQKGILPYLSFITTITLPGTGYENYQIDNVNPTIGLLAGHSVNNWLGVTTNFRYTWDSELVQNAFGYAMSFDYTFTDRWGGFTEFYGNVYSENNNEHLFNAGLVFEPDKNLQLDASFGVGFTDRAPDFFISGGVAYRLKLF